jgi:hypothetical protein
MTNNNTRGASIDELVDFISFNSVYDAIDNAIGAAERKQHEEYKNGGEAPFYMVFMTIKKEFRYSYCLISIAEVI